MRVTKTQGKCISAWFSAICKTKQLLQKTTSTRIRSDQAEYQRIKDVLQIYLQILDVGLQKEPSTVFFSDVSRSFNEVDEVVLELLHHRIYVRSPHKASECFDQFTMSSELPDITVEDLTRAHLAFSKCDDVTAGLCPLLAEALKPLGATVKGIKTVLVDGHVRFNIVEFGLCNGNSLHSVLEVTAPHDKYIVDFTGEQFGLPRTSWFMRSTDFYKTSTYVRTLDIASVGKDGLVPVVQDVVRFCEEQGWPGIWAMQQEQRLEFVKRRAEEFFDALFANS